MLKQTYQCEKSNEQSDAFLNFLDIINKFMGRFSSLLKENYASSINNIKELRIKEIEQFYTCNTCINKYKYQISGKCDEVYQYDSKGYSNTNEESNYS